MRFAIPSPGSNLNFLRIVYNAPLDDCQVWSEWEKNCESFVGGESFAGFRDMSFSPTCEVRSQDFVEIGRTLPPPATPNPAATILPNINEQCGIWQRSARVLSAFQFNAPFEPFFGSWFIPNRLSELNSPNWAHVGTVELEYV
jgi:hypothetical protein